MASGRFELSTGHDIQLPLVCRARLGGAVFAAEWAPLRAALPRDLTPLRVAPRRGAVTLVGIEYQHVGPLDPYCEFAVIVAVSSDGVAGLPTSRSGVGGYVVDLPVTTEPARALGDEIWGYPKSVTDIDVEASPTAFSTRVDADGHADVRLDVDSEGQPRRIRNRLTSFTHLDDRLVRVPVDLDAELRVASGGESVRLARGHRRYGAVLRDLGLTPRVYARFVASHAVAEFHEPSPVG